MRRLFLISVLASALAITGMMVATSGIIPVKASAGHWDITSWFLHFTMQRSIATWSVGITTPPLDEPGLVLKGAEHYHTGCRPCHGSPGLHPPRVTQGMLPPPPYLAPKLSKWQPAELFFITKHGIKYTGMPAWPTQKRDDEVWAMTAFLRKLPDLDSATYQQLIYGDLDSAKLSTRQNTRQLTLTESTTDQNGIKQAEEFAIPATSRSLPVLVNQCNRCHGVDGKGRGPNAFPKLAGQRTNYLYESLRAYASGKRYSGIMQPIAAELSSGEMQRLADHYATKRPAPTDLDRTIEIATRDNTARRAIERGEIISRRGIPEKKVPACARCHEVETSRRNPIYPRLAGQYADYLMLQLNLLKRNQRGGTDFSHLMQPIATRMTDAQIHDVVFYYSSHN